MVTGIHLKDKQKQNKTNKIGKKLWSAPAVLFFSSHQGPYVVPSLFSIQLISFLYFISWFMRNHWPVSSLKNSIFNIASICHSEAERAWPWIQESMNSRLCSESHWLCNLEQISLLLVASAYSSVKWRKYPDLKIIARMKKCTFEAQQSLIINICEALSILLLLLCWQLGLQ